MLSGITNWVSTKVDSVKRAWNDTNEIFRDTILNLSCITLGSGKILKDIGIKLFFLYALLTPILGTSHISKGFTISIASIFVAGVCYTNYLTSYSSLKYKIFKRCKEFKLNNTSEVNENSPLLANQQRESRQSNSINCSELPLIMPNSQDQQHKSCSTEFKDLCYFMLTRGIVLTRLFFVFCDTYLGANKLFSKTANIFETKINKDLLNKLTVGVGTYLATSDGILFCSYAYRIFLENSKKIAESLTWEKIKSASKWKLILTSFFASLGILSKGVKDCFEISSSLKFVPLIKALPKDVLTKLGYAGGVNSIAAKSVFEGYELARNLYDPKPFINDMKELSQESKTTYVKLLAFFLNSLTEGAGGYLGVKKLFNEFGLSEELEKHGCLNPVVIPISLLVSCSVFATSMAFNARCLQDNKRHEEELKQLFFNPANPILQSNQENYPQQYSPRTNSRSPSPRRSLA